MIRIRRDTTILPLVSFSTKYRRIARSFTTDEIEHLFFQSGHGRSVLFTFLLGTRP